MSSPRHSSCVGSTVEFRRSSVNNCDFTLVGVLRNPGCINYQLRPGLGGNRAAGDLRCFGRNRFSLSSPCFKPSIQKRCLSPQAQIIKSEINTCGGTNVISE